MKERNAKYFGRARRIKKYNYKVIVNEKNCDHAASVLLGL